ncbi:MAG: hypothetical protein NT026_02875 [Candidatus Staskawiczbacteria bacterium]|nr:hypothetical protein [Candidatus Staskawiczbacteria bacterium]
MKDILQSKTFKAVILGIGGLIILAFVFGLGVFVGTKKADFSFQWADEYHRNFGGPQGGFFGDLMGTENELPNSNGCFGQIIKIVPSTKSGQDTLTVRDIDNTEKVVLIDSKTVIILQKKNIKLSDLKVDDNIICIGSPNSLGQIEAKLIRVMPPPPQKLLPQN